MSTSFSSVLFAELHCIPPPTALECVKTRYIHRQLHYHVFVGMGEQAASKAQKSVWGGLPQINECMGNSALMKGFSCLDCNHI